MQLPNTSTFSIVPFADPSRAFYSAADSFAREIAPLEPRVSMENLLPTNVLDFLRPSINCLRRVSWYRTCVNISFPPAFQDQKQSFSVKLLECTGENNGKLEAFNNRLNIRGKFVIQNEIGKMKPSYMN